MAAVRSPPVDLAHSSPPHGWASLSSSPAYHFDSLLPSSEDNLDGDDVHSQRVFDSQDQLDSSATDRSNGFTPTSDSRRTCSTPPGGLSLTEVSAFPPPPNWRDPLLALEGRSTPFNPVFTHTPPPSAGKGPRRLGPSSLWLGEDELTPPPATGSASLWERVEINTSSQGQRLETDAGDQFPGYLEPQAQSSTGGARQGEVEKLFKIVQILAERVQQLESTQAAHEAELGRLRTSRFAQQRPPHAHTPQPSNDGQLTPAQMRSLQSQIGLGGPHSTSPGPLSAAARQGLSSFLPSNSAGGSRSLTPHQSSGLSPLSPIKSTGTTLRPMTPPRLPYSGPSAGFTFGVGVPPSPTDSFAPGPNPNCGLHSSNMGRSTSLHDLSPSPTAATPHGVPFAEHGLSIPSIGDRIDCGEGFDWSVGPPMGGGGLFGMMSSSSLMNNPRRGRTRAQSEGVGLPTLAQTQRARGTSFSQIAPIVAQAKWMASNQPPQPVFAPTGTSMMGPFGMGPMPPGPAEHINYRALVEHDLEIDAESFVRRILTHNDQQCSMYLQQRLKTSTQEHRKTNIIDAVAHMLLDLCLSKFGNFLVSRCLEQGGLALAIEWTKKLKGQLLTLSLDPFGCHCVQKLLDCGDKTTKNLVVDEIIDHAETLTQKNSGHVWSKLLATMNPPAFYERLSATGAGSWAQIAKEETGSLVVQSILESWEGAYASSIASDCERDIVGLATSQWGSFVLLHLIEHGSSSFRSRAVEPSAGLSLDHFGAKAVKKAFKSGDISPSAVTAYVESICRSGESGRPAVIDIASHASGSQLLTLLFTGSFTTYDDKTKLIHAVRSYGVTLKQNKHGQKIYFLCERARSWAGH